MVNISDHDIPMNIVGKRRLNANISFAYIGETKKYIYYGCVSRECVMGMGPLYYQYKFIISMLLRHKVL